MIDDFESDLIDDFDAKCLADSLAACAEEEEEEEEEVVEPVSHAEAAAYISSLQAYCHHQRNRMSSTLLAKADSVFTQLRSHSNTRSVGSQQRMETFFTALS